MLNTHTGGQSWQPNRPLDASLFRDAHLNSKIYSQQRNKCCLLETNVVYIWDFWIYSVDKQQHRNKKLPMVKAHLQDCLVIEKVCLQHNIKNCHSKSTGSILQHLQLLSIHAKGISKLLTLFFIEQSTRTGLHIDKLNYFSANVRRTLVSKTIKQAWLLLGKSIHLCPTLFKLQCW